MLAVFSALPNWSLHAELLIHFASTPAWITLFCFDMSFCVMPILLSCERKGPDDRFYDHLRCLFALESVSSNQAHQSFFVLMLYATTWMSASKKTGIHNRPDLRAWTGFPFISEQSRTGSPTAKQVLFFFPEKLTTFYEWLDYHRLQVIDTIQFSCFSCVPCAGGRCWNFLCLFKKIAV